MMRGQSKAWPALGAGALLVVASCRQLNPDWKGDETTGTSTSTDAAVTTEVPTSTTTVDPTASPGTTAVDSSSSGSFATEGQPCNNDNTCGDGWLCGPMGCQQGMAGDPCTGNGDCAAPTALCGPDDVCQAGGAGDPCADNNDCAAPTAICGPMATCQSGATGDPCTSPSHCMGGIGCTDDVCE